MQVFREQHKCVNGKRMTIDNVSERILQERYVRFFAKKPSAVMRDDGKEERCAFCSRSPVLHVSSGLMRLQQR
jgi:hypothetical protein